MKRFLSLFAVAALIVAMVACGNRRGQTRNAGVPTAEETAYVETQYPIEIDVSKEYDKRTITLQDVAEVSYVPFETSKDVLLDGAAEKRLRVSEYRDGRVYGKSGSYYMVSGHGVFPITSNGDEFVLSDYACDTIYTLKGRRLSPFMISVNAKENEDVGVVLRTTRYTVLSIGELSEDVNADHAQKFLGVDHRNGDIFEVDFLNSDFTEDVTLGSVSFDSNNKILPVETAVVGYSALELVDWRDAGKLKGRLAEIAATLKEEDNPVLILIKFKK